MSGRRLILPMSVRRGTDTRCSSRAGAAMAPTRTSAIPEAEASRATRRERSRRSTARMILDAFRTAAPGAGPARTIGSAQGEQRALTGKRPRFRDSPQYRDVLVGRIESESRCASRRCPSGVGSGVTSGRARSRGRGRRMCLALVNALAGALFGARRHPLGKLRAVFGYPPISVVSEFGKPREPGCREPTSGQHSQERWHCLASRASLAGRRDQMP
jgi:hypothetical protein